MELSAVHDIPDQKERVEKYTEWVAERIAANEVAPLQDLASSMVSEHRGGAGEVLVMLADAICAAPASFPRKEASRALLGVIEDLSSKFAAAVHTLQLLLSGLAETEGDIEGAAVFHSKASSVCLDTKSVEDREKIDTLLKAASLFVKCGKASEAERLLHDCKVKVKSPFKPSQKLLYNQVNAQVLDMEANFIVAARVHLQVAQDKEALQSSQITQAAQIDSLSCAARCALVSPAGEKRDEMLQALCKDDRVDSIPTASLVRKAEQHRLLRESDVAALKAAVTEYQLPGVDHAVAEHNLLAASALYKNISTRELGHLLNADAKAAEKTAASMISDGRLFATISQVTGSVTFASRKDDAAADEQVEVICDAVQDLQAKIRVA